jgi:hypothetical protein
MNTLTVKPQYFAGINFHLNRAQSFLVLQFTLNGSQYYLQKHLF